MAVTDCAGAHSAPATGVADLGRSPKKAARAAIDQAAFLLIIFAMPTLEKQLATVAMALPPKKRAKLAGLILDSIETKRDKAIAVKWAAEADSRAKAHKKGLLKAVSLERAFGFSV